MPVLLTAMHRSGTSMLAQWVHGLGVPEAPGTPFPVDSANSEGLFERIEIVALDDEWLARLGGAWNVPPATTDHTWRTLDLHDLEASRNRLTIFSGRSGQWFVKDPRICLVLPLWDRLTLRRLPVITTVRPHRDVAASLAVRNGMTGRRALALWSEYYRRLVETSRNRRTMLIDYGQALAAPADAVQAVGRFLTTTGVEIGPAATERVAAAVRPNLRRQDTDRLPGSSERLAADLDPFLEELIRAHLTQIPRDLPVQPDWAAEALDEMREEWALRRQIAELRQGRTAAERVIRRTGARLRTLGQ